MYKVASQKKKRTDWFSASEENNLIDLIQKETKPLNLHKESINTKPKQSKRN